MRAQSIGQLLATHPFFHHLPLADIQLIAGCGKNVVFKAGESIAEQNEAVQEFYIIRQGLVSVEIHVPPRGSVRLQTLTRGDVLGSFGPFAAPRWNFDLRALDTVHAVALNEKCIAGKCDADPAVGYHLMKRFAEAFSERLRAAHLQLLDVYAPPKITHRRPDARTGASR